MRKFPNNITGIFWIIVWCLFDAVVAVASRIIGNDFSIYQSVFFTNLGALILILPLLFRIQFKTKKLPLYALRGLLEALGTSLWFMAIRQSPLNEVTALSNFCPLLIAVGAILFLGEKNRIYRWVALLAGFLGVLLIISPDGLMPSTGAMLTIGSAFCFATCGIIIKILTRTEQTISIIFYMFLFTALFSLPLSISGLSVITITSHIGILAVISASYLLLQFAVARAFSHTALTVLMPFTFLGLIFIAVAGYVFFGEVPSIWSLAGGTIILSSVILSAIYESKRATKKFAGT